MSQASSKFRWWLLLIYMVGGSTLWSLYIAYLSIFPPNREALGDETYTSAWRWIVVGGAAQGATIYFMTLYLPRIAAWWRRRIMVDSSSKK